MIEHRSDFLAWEGTRFKDNVRNIGRIYEAAFEALEASFDTNWQELAEQKLDEEFTDTDLNLERICLSEDWSEQQPALACMCLALLEVAAFSFLDRGKQYLDKLLPRKLKYEGKSKLLRLIKEYRARFNIDLEQTPEFATLREIILARNSCIHNEGEPSAEYKKRTGSSFIDPFGKINLNCAQVRTMTSELIIFGEGVIRQLCSVRDQHGGSRSTYLTRGRLADGSSS